MPASWCHMEGEVREKSRPTPQIPEIYTATILAQAADPSTVDQTQKWFPNLSPRPTHLLARTGIRYHKNKQDY